MSVVAPGAIEDPPLTFRDELRAQWVAANTPAVGTPSIETAKWDRASTRPQVCVTTHDGVKTDAGIAADGRGPLRQIDGFTQIECCAVLDKRASPVVPPKVAIKQMSKEVLRILGPAWAGLGDLEDVKAGEPGLDVDTNSDPVLWRHIITVEWRYFEQIP
jgi:hypothetical protein